MIEVVAFFLGHPVYMHYNEKLCNMSSYEGRIQDLQIEGAQQIKCTQRKYIPSVKREIKARPGRDPGPAYGP